MADGTARAVGPAIATSLTGQGSLASAAAGVEPLRLVQRAPSRYERRLKPMVDRAAALLLLMLFSPLLLAVALLVRVNLGPGVLYRQVRIGQDGEPFSMLKFRTMQPDRRRTADGELRIDRRLGADRRSGDDRRQAVIAIDGPERRQGPIVGWVSAERRRAVVVGRTRHRTTRGTLVWVGSSVRTAWMNSPSSSTCCGVS
jgi:hypothetical protein